MAQQVIFHCLCGKHLEAWSDGNPYFIDETGQKQYAYHPSKEERRCIGNDVPHICLDCGRQTKIDTRNPRTKCTKCRSTRLKDTYDLDGEICPFCKQEKLVGLPGAIS